MEMVCKVKEHVCSTHCAKSCTPEISKGAAKMHTCIELYDYCQVCEHHHFSFPVMISFIVFAEFVPSERFLLISYFLCLKGNLLFGTQISIFYPVDLI